MNKQMLRKQMKEIREAVVERERKSQAIFEQIVQLNAYKESDILLAYLAIRSEVSLSELIERALKDGKKVAVPRITGPHIMEFRLYTEAHLEEGSFHTIQPTMEAPIPDLKEHKVLMIAPGLAFTKDGIRLGYGGGYYDTFLKKMPRITVYGAAYDEQIIRDIPIDEHDRYIDGVVTPGGFYDCICTRNSETD